MRIQLNRIGIAAVLLVLACARTPAPAPPTPEPPSRPVEPPAEPPRTPSLRIGAIVSNTGPAVLRQYTDLVLEGARVAATSASTSRRTIELVVRDDGGTPAGAAAAVRELERTGVRAFIGPLVDNALTSAAAARAGPAPMISPTAVSESVEPNVYTLNAPDTRGSAALGAWAARHERIGLLHARTAEGRRQAAAFLNALPSARRAAVTTVPFDSGATNVSTQLSRLRQARVQVVYFPATDRELQLILPQIDYFGLRGVQLLGNETWIGDGARGLPSRVLQGAIVATPLWRESRDVAWGEFVGRYEATYRRTLPNALPALGYDALMLAVRVVDGDVDDADIRGATGIFSLRGDSVTRRPFLVRIDGSRLVPVD